MPLRIPRVSEVRTAAATSNKLPADQKGREKKSRAPAAAKMAVITDKKTANFHAPRILALHFGGQLVNGLGARAVLNFAPVTIPWEVCEQIRSKCRRRT